MKSFKPTPRVTLRLGGYDDMTQQILPVSANLKTQGDGGKDNPVPEATVILMNI